VPAGEAAEGGWFGKADSASAAGRRAWLVVPAYAHSARQRADTRWVLENAERIRQDLEHHRWTVDRSTPASLDAFIDEVDAAIAGGSASTPSCSSATPISAASSSTTRAAPTSGNGCKPVGTGRAPAACSTPRPGPGSRHGDVTIAENEAAGMDDWRVQVFFDGDCPLCMREIRVLRRLDRRGHIWFTDIAAPEFEARRCGTSQQDLMARIRGRLPTGEWIEGVEVFRQLYAAVGFGGLVWLSRMPVVSHALDLGYRLFAKNRLRLTGRAECHSGVCARPEHGHEARHVGAGL